MTIPVNGTVNNSWNCTLVQNGGEATVSSASYNASIAPGAAASFALCVVF